MNWFGLFTTALIVVLLVWGFAFEYGYEKAEKDWTMSKEWLDRLEMENNSWSSHEAQEFLRSRNNHPTNKDWN
jgi:hypothetical protein